MKKAGAIAAIIAALVALCWLAGSRFLNTRALDADSARWPNNLGNAEAIAKHFPSHGENETAKSVDAIAKRTDADASLRAAISDYVSHAIASGSDVVDAPPPIAEWLAKHADDIRALQHQLAGHDVPQWSVDAETLSNPPTPRLLSIVKLARVLSLDALERHRGGNDAAAWDDLHATWRLAQGLVARPELLSQLVGISCARMSNGIAAKLSAPAPAWRHELASFDFSASAIASLAFEATHHWNVMTRQPAGKVAFSPLLRYRAGQALEAQRELVTQLASLTACDPHPRIPRNMKNIAEAWRRIGRFRAEIEGVEKLLALKAARAQSGSWPQSMPSIEGSSCSDGRWRYTREADGSMSLAFSKAIPVTRFQNTVVPLAFRYGP